MTTSAYHATTRRKPQALRDRLQGRLHAAEVNGGAQAAQPRGNGIFTVFGRAETRYTVRIFDLDNIRCDCKAGQYGTPCWHAGAAYLRAIADRALETAGGAGPTVAERLAANPWLETRELVTVDSIVKVIRRDDRGFKYVVELDGAVVNRANALFAAQLQARHIQSEIHAKRINAQLAASRSQAVSA